MIAATFFNFTVISHATTATNQHLLVFNIQRNSLLIDPFHRFCKQISKSDSSPISEIYQFIASPSLHRSRWWFEGWRCKASSLYECCCCLLPLTDSSLSISLPHHFYKQSHLSTLMKLLLDILQPNLSFMTSLSEMISGYFWDVEIQERLLTGYLKLLRPSSTIITFLSPH